MVASWVGGGGVVVPVGVGGDGCAGGRGDLGEVLRESSCGCCTQDCALFGDVSFCPVSRDCTTMREHRKCVKSRCAA